MIKKILYTTKLEVLIGGGIRDIQDLRELKKLGVSGALVATALHDGKLKVDELKSAGFM
jgi:phosphoribosylformimino-5-aminoimidazole carboxamide ribotide isomerase